MFTPRTEYPMAYRYFERLTRSRHWRGLDQDREKTWVRRDIESYDTPAVSACLVHQQNKVTPHTNVVMSEICTVRCRYSAIAPSSKRIRESRGGTRLRCNDKSGHIHRMSKRMGLALLEIVGRESVISARGRVCQLNVPLEYLNEYSYESARKDEMHRVN